MPRIHVDNLGSVGVIKDVPAHKLPPEGWSDADAMRFTAAGAEQIQSEREVLSDASDPAGNPTWLKQFPTTAAPLWMYSIPESAVAAADGNIYVVDSGVLPVHSEIARSAGGNYNTIVTERPTSFVHMGLGYWNSVEDIPQLWAPMTAGTPMIDLSAWDTNPEVDAGSTRCRMMRSYKNFIVIGDITDLTAPGARYPFRIRWSDAAEPGTAPTTWDVTVATNLSGETDLADTPDYVIDGKAYGDAFIIYKERTTWGMQFIGGTDGMRFWPIFPDMGILHRDCVVAFPKGHVVCTQDDLVVHQGQFGSEQSILNNRLRRWLFSNIDSTYYYNSFFCMNHPAKEVWFCFPTSVNLTANPNGFATKTIIWNWEDNTIGLRDLPEAGIPFAQPGPIVLADEPLTWGV